MALAQVLADLYPTETDQRRIADQLGLEATVDIDGSAIVVWHNIVQRARQHKRIGMLIVTALTEFPRNGSLPAAIDDELSRRNPVPHNDYDDDDRSERRGDQAFLIGMLRRMENRIEAVQKENVERRHAQDNTLQALVSQVAVLASQEAARGRREEQMQESISKLDGRMSAVEGALRSLTAEGRAEAHVGALDIRHAVWLALGFVAALGMMLIAAQYLVGNL